MNGEYTFGVFNTRASILFQFYERLLLLDVYKSCLESNHSENFTMYYSFVFGLMCQHWSLKNIAKSVDIRLIGAELHSTLMRPRSSASMPIFFRPSPSVYGERLVATRRISASIVSGLPPVDFPQFQLHLPILH